MYSPKPNSPTIVDSEKCNIAEGLQKNIYDYFRGSQRGGGSRF